MTTATKGKAMGKPRKLRDDRLDDMTDARVLPQPGDPYPPPVETLAEVDGETTAIVDGEVLSVPKPRVTDFVPRKCSACTALRSDDENYTRVTTTRHIGGHIVRYCKCTFCGNTFKD